MPPFKDTASFLCHGRDRETNALFRERGGWPFRPAVRPVLPWQIGSSCVADGHCRPPWPPALWLTAPLSVAHCAPCGASCVQRGPVLVQPPSVGVTLPAVQQLGMSRSGSLSSASRPQQYLQRKFPVEQGFSALALQTFGGGSFSVVGAVLCSVGRLPASKCHRIPEATLVHL